MRRPKRNEDMLGIDAPSGATKTAAISPERIDAPIQSMTIGELRDAFGQGLPILTDEVKKFLGLETDQVACVTSTMHIIYHPLVCMAMAAEGVVFPMPISPVARISRPVSSSARTTAAPASMA